MKNILKKYKYYLLAFLIPIILVYVNFIINNIDLSSNSLLVSDMNGQYITLFSYFKDVLEGKESIFYSFNNGLGSSMYSTYAYYLSSPLNVLVVFFDKEYLPLFVSLLLLLKIGLCGLTMNIYIKNKFNMKKTDSIIFSTCYALMSFIINYHFNTMWLDGVYMLPLVMIGIDKIIREDKFVLYCASLFITIISNFYIAYMICIFSVIYFTYQLFLECDRKEYKHKIINFLFCSLLSGLCTAFLTLPTFLESRNFSRPENIFGSGSIITRLLYLVRDILIGTHECKDLGNTNGTYLYCGILIIYLNYLYFTNSKISKKEKIFSGIFFIFLIASSIFKPLQYIWHGFSYTYSFNNRFSFLISFYMIMIAAKSYMNLEKINIKKNILFVIFNVMLGIVLGKKGYITMNSAIISFCFLIIYALVIENIKYKYFSLLLTFLILVELFINLNISFLFNKDQTITFGEFYHIFCDDVNQLDLNYRIGQNYYYGGLDNLLCGYSSITKYISTNKQNESKFFYDVGYEVSGIFYADETTNTEIIDSLLGIKYNYSNISNKYLPSNHFIRLSQLDMASKKSITSSYELYENENALSIAYMIKDKDINIKNDPFIYQNDLIKKMSGINKNSLIEIDYEKIDDTNYKIYALSNQKIYIKLNYNQNTSAFNEDLYDVYINGEKLYSKNYSIFYYFNTEASPIILSIKKINDNIKFKDIEVYTIDENILKNQIDELKKNEAINISKQKNKLIFDINNDSNDDTLLLTVPYEKGFNVYVDNKQVNYYEILNAFVGINLEKGYHHIEIVYYPRGLRTGIIISIISLFLVIIYFKKYNRGHGECDDHVLR